MKYLLNKKLQILFCIGILVYNVSLAQNVDLGNLSQTFNKKNILKVTGDFNANGVWNNGTDQSFRDPFNWYLQGNLNFNLFGQVNIPLSMNITNAGNNFSAPTMPNRIGIHPTYKWVTAHIGDVAMSFSPYTLNGHQFTGAGFDISPKGRFKISAMYGRLQKAVEYDSNNTAGATAYRRMGYGSKILYTAPSKKASFGITVFGAKDNISSLNFKPDSVNILPQQNFVTSFNTSLKPSDNVEFNAEYAISALTKDVRDTTEVTSKTSNLLSSFIDAKNSTGYFKALKLGVNLHIQSTVIGIGYERVDPGYKTLGAYFFANDLENITFNFSKNLFKNKVSLSGNFGLQRDNLDDAKSAENKRYIFATNINYNPTDKISATFSYSNFKTFMNIRPLFQLLNQVNQFQRLDTLNYSQIAQNANMNLNFILQQSKATNQNFNINFSYQDAVDKQGGKTTDGGDSKFYNATASYSIMFVPAGINLMAAYNYCLNTLTTGDYKIMGPTLGINSKLFKKKVSLGLTGSYNESTASVASQPKTTVLNLRLNASYTFFKKHNILLSVINQNRNIEGSSDANNTLGNIGYSFSF